jgi:phospholipid-transporting ATPase
MDIQNAKLQRVHVETLCLAVFIVTFQSIYIYARLKQKRHRADDEINHRKVEVLRDGHWLWIQWLNVMVGDIVKVHNNTFFPADLAILSSR